MGTEDVQLRDVQAGDLEIFYQHQLDSEATAMAAFPARERATFMAHWEKILGAGAIWKQTILYRGQVAGNIVCFESEGRSYVGYWIGKAYWGRGVATRALAAFLDHVSPRPLHAVVASHNAGSIRVLEKCGFARIDDDRPPDGPGDDVEELLFRLEAAPPPSGP
jgi:RimJ/RimL family protein N-acetyltransferase